MLELRLSDGQLAARWQLSRAGDVGAGQGRLLAPLTSRRAQDLWGLGAYGGLGVWPLILYGGFVCAIIAYY